MLLAVSSILASSGAPADATSARITEGGRNTWLAAFRRTAAVKSAHFDVTASIAISGHTTTLHISGEQTFHSATPRGRMVTTTERRPGLTDTYLLTDEAVFIKYGEGSGAALPGGAIWERIDLGRLRSIFHLKRPLLLLDGALGDADPAETLQLMSSAAVGRVRDIGANSAAGVPVTWYKGMVNLDSLLRREEGPLQRLVLHQSALHLTSPVVPVEIGVDRAGRVCEITETIGARRRAHGAVRKMIMHVSMHLSDFGQPVVVQAPPASEVYVTPISVLREAAATLGI